MATKTVSFRLPVELVDSIEAEAIATGQSRTEIVTAILSKFYNFPYVSQQSLTLAELQEQVDELKHLMANSLENNQVLPQSKYNLPLESTNGVST